MINLSQFKSFRSTFFKSVQKCVKALWVVLTKENCTNESPKNWMLKKSNQNQQVLCRFTGTLGK